MRVLIDENVPADLAGELTGHDCVTVQQLGWSGVKNGELLRRAAGRFDAFLTMDTNLEHQQPLTEQPFGFVIVRARSNRTVHLRPLIGAVLKALSGLQAGEVRRIGG